jgi:hypothetical protein
MSLEEVTNERPREERESLMYEDAFLWASSRSWNEGEDWVMDLREAFRAYTSCTGAGHQYPS